MRVIDPASRLSGMAGVSVGHWSDHEAMTGCTVVMFEKSSTASVHVAGGAPGSQETDLLDPSCLVAGVDAVFLTGGSAFGLAAASGVRRYLEEIGRGFKAGGHMIPIVPAAVIFDLAVGDGSVRPGPDEGYAACVAAESRDAVEGAIGAGTGARVAKYLGPDKSAPGGLASRFAVTENGASVGALMVVNSYGAVVNHKTGEIVTAAAGDNGAPQNYLDAPPMRPDFGATCIGVIVTDAALSKADLKRVAIMAHDGLARTIVPAHTPYDGDMIFAVSTGAIEADVSRVGAWAAELVAECIVTAVGGGK